MESGISKQLPAAFKTGLVLLCLSLLALVVSCYEPKEEKRIVCLLITHMTLLIYFFWMWISGALKANPDRRKVTAVFVVLLLVDAYTVNNVITVFELHPTWFVVTLSLLCANILAFCFFRQWPEWRRYLQCAILGFTMLAPVYLAFYLLNMYIIGLIGLVAIGISIVTFSPLFLLWFNLRMVRKEIWAIYHYRVIYLSALSLSAVIVIAYTLVYAVNLRTIDDTYRQADKADAKLPAWIRVAQELPQGFITEEILKTDITYRAPQRLGEMDFLGMPQREYDSELKHDPLFIISALLCGTSIVPEEERVKILSVVYDKRHYAEERLWSGKELVTTKVSTAADVWPRYHLAYTEHTITVANTGADAWRGTEEAIYTFHLPEGAVVTSLSLWINNSEEKAVLTTKQKADTAYKEIVGVQQRDPSVVHWQEGNRVVVRVFPVAHLDSRKFKIGITSPLIAREGKLVYEPAWFEGPAYSRASYEVKLNMDSWPKDMLLPEGFIPGKANTITREGDYDGNWELKMPDESVENAAFSFNGQRYTLLPHAPAYQFFAPRNYYLDINHSWQYSDYRDILTALKNKPVWVFHPQKGMIAVNEGNQDTLFEELQQYRFSVFPFHHIEDPVTAIVISASGSISPQLEDIRDSPFRGDLLAALVRQPVRLYDIGGTSSPYLATLKESRSLIYENGTVTRLLKQLGSNSFVKPDEDNGQLVIAGAGMRIVRTQDSTGTTGPDHLARLYAYNKVLKELGPRISATGNGNDTALITIAREAYVVSPLSSLVVLEKQADYDKFDIKDDINGLKNASLKGHGSVPEPHEWALFIIAVVLLAYVRFEKLFKRKSNAC
ncbi:XrtN system VIT domain-containing protein [Chitinophaga sp. 22321]|uniref:XrtN system VIT domain-containing protein n=1 Tax=Chitinophaga hostae TaxID=2831022 RepID=A0ABS5J1S6_9BACT|nr:XrtN system VIT domain-containing protein [Chitinophaga hostae]MBS0029182.1 XrtN system VIT domain-containing protein [Chitinophaga hostae]